MLVHMTPNEVHGLQALAKAHGGSLTVNPKTGLPEAGFLESVLPIVAMAAATYFTAGAAAPALSAALAGETALAAGTVTAAGGAAAGALSGAGVGAVGSALQGKDVGKGALYGGIGGAIAGGMGAYGGPESAATSGASEAAQASKAVEGVNSGAQLTDVTKQMAGNGYGQAANAPMTQQQFADTSAFTGTPQAPGSVPAGGPSPTIDNTPTQAEINQIRSPGATGKPSYYSEMGMPSKAMTLAAPGLGADIGMNTPKTQMPGTESYSSQATLSPDFQGYTPTQPNPYYKAQYTRYAADGGLMALAGGGSLEDKKKKQRASLTADRTLSAMSADQAGLANLNNARHAANMTGASPLSSMSLGDLPNPVGAAGGGLANLGGYSDGGRLLKGPGDGMSDNIPAQIGRKQPARLADGEFVVPADVVSHLGNGSTDAGAKRLYSMMDKVRQARTGKKKQAPAVSFKQGVPV
jgi:hypothetical protein